MGVEPPRITLPVIAADLERLAKVLVRAASEMRKPRELQELDGVVDLAERHLKLRRRRAELFDGDLFGEPVWDILLDLFVARAQDRQLSVTAVAYGSGVPVSTALRWISLLEKRGLIVRTSSARDKRRAHLEIAPHAVEAMEQLLSLELRTA